ncbi:hypothetical protein FB451DRAFT_1250096 [Mycena latifolia]|nr:hypothetical protein FB451DRAFT_1250096 [Mycena latifolia]
MSMLNVARRDAVMLNRKQDVSWLRPRPTRLIRKASHSRSEPAPLLPYRLTDAKENMDQCEQFARDAVVTGIKGTHDRTIHATASDVWPSMAPLVLFPSSVLAEEYKLDHQAVRAGDLGLLQSGLPTGGCLVTVHEPDDATSWIEANSSHPFLSSLHQRGINGPLPMMLSPHTQGLAIFASPNNPRVVEYAESLVKLANMAVVIRPEGDNPIPKFARLSNITEGSIDSKKITSFSNGMDSVPGPGSFESSRNNVNESGNNGHEGEGEGGGGGDDQTFQGDGKGGSNGGDKGEGKTPLNGNADKGGRKKWERLTHRVLAACKLKVDATRTYDFTVESIFKFAAPIPPDENTLDRDAMFQSLDVEADIEAFTKLEVATNGCQLLVDATYASLGFEGHRKGSLHSCKYIPGGNELARKYHTQRRQAHAETSKGGTAGYSDFMPKIELNINHRKGQSTGIETTTDRPAPDWIVRQQLGNRFNEEQKSYISIATSYEPQVDPFDVAPKPLDVNVGLRLVLADQDNPDEVKISFVNRNQIHLWVSEPDSKAGSRGVIFLVSNYLPNIRTERKLKITEDGLCVDISRPVGASSPSSSSTAGSSISAGKEETPDDGLRKAKNSEVFDFAVAQVQKIPTSGKLRKSPPSTPPAPSVQLHPYVTRGWDTTTKCWLAPVWPDLDEGFKAVDAFRPGVDHPTRQRCWKLDR